MIETIKISLAISHTPWVQDRADSMSRLRKELNIPNELLPYLEMRERMPNWEWSAKMWNWAAKQAVTHCLFLQDDVHVAPNFWEAIHAMVRALPDQVIGLHTCHRHTTMWARKGCRWITTSDGLVGVGYLLPRQLLLQFLAWRDAEVMTAGLQAITEDSLICCWMLATGRNCWHPIPTIIDHDTKLASTYGNDDHKGRRSEVTWNLWDAEHQRRMGDPDFWKPCAVPLLGRYYTRTPWMCKQYVQEWTIERHARAISSVWRGEFV